MTDYEASLIDKLNSENTEGQIEAVRYSIG